MNVGTLISFLTLDTSGYAKGVKDAVAESAALEKQISSAEKSTLSMATALKSAAGAVVTFFAASKIKDAITDVSSLAARYETMGVVMNTVGKNAGYTAEQLSYVQSQLQKTGITALESRDSITKLAQSDIELADATKLARIAQDAAVIANTNSSEAFARLIHGIQSGETEILKNLGLNVSMEEAQKKYATQLGTTTSKLTQTQKTHAMVNAVIEEGAKLTGTYEAALGTLGKKIGSLARPWENFKVAMGEAFTGAEGVFVDWATSTLKTMETWVTENKRLITEWANALKSAAEWVVSALKLVYVEFERISNALKLLQAYKAGDISFGEYAGMNVEEAAAYLKYGREYLDMVKELAAWREKASKFEDLESSTMSSTWATETTNIRQNIDGLKERIEALKTSKDEEKKAADAVYGDEQAISALTASLVRVKSATELKAEADAKAAAAAKELEKQQKAYLAVLAETPALAADWLATQNAMIDAEAKVNAGKLTSGQLEQWVAEQRRDAMDKSVAMLNEYYDKQMELNGFQKKWLDDYEGFNLKGDKNIKKSKIATAKEIADIYKDLYDTLKNGSAQYLKYASKALDEEYKAKKELLVAYLKANNATNDEILAAEKMLDAALLKEKTKLNVEAAKKGDSFVKGFIAGIEDMKTAMTTLGTLGYEVFGDLREAWQDGFYALVTGDMDSWKDVWDNLLDTLLKRFTDFVADLILQWALVKVLDLAISISGGSSSTVGGLLSSAATAAAGKTASSYLLGGASAAAASESLGATSISGWLAGETGLTAYLAEQGATTATQAAMANSGSVYGQAAAYQSAGGTITSEVLTEKGIETAVEKGASYGTQYGVEKGLEQGATTLAGSEAGASTELLGMTISETSVTAGWAGMLVAATLAAFTNNFGMGSGKDDDAWHAYEYEEAAYWAVGDSDEGTAAGIFPSLSQEEHDLTSYLTQLSEMGDIMTDAELDAMHCKDAVELAGQALAYAGQAAGGDIDAYNALVATFELMGYGSEKAAAAAAELIAELTGAEQAALDLAAAELDAAFADLANDMDITGESARSANEAVFGLASELESTGWAIYGLSDSMAGATAVTSSLSTTMDGLSSAFSGAASSAATALGEIGYYASAAAAASAVASSSGGDYGSSVAGSSGDSGGISDWSASALPQFAEGGLASGPTTGYPVMLHGNELITPLDKLLGGASGKQNIVVHVHVGNEEFQSYVQQQADGVIVARASRPNLGSRRAY